MTGFAIFSNIAVIKETALLERFNLIDIKCIRFDGAIVMMHMCTIDE